jgi:hypothetical protein
MDSPLLDQSRDPLLAFASEAPVAPAADREPAFLRTPTPYDGYLSITAVPERATPGTVRGPRVTTFLVAVGVLAGFAAGYAFADRIVGLGATPADRVAVPPPAPAPALTTAAAAPAVAPAASSETTTPVTEPAKPVTEPSSGLVREAPVVEAAQAARASAAPARPTPRSTARASIPSSTTRPSRTRQPQAAVAPTTAPTTALGGSIVITSRPRGAQVLLDGSVVGQAPMSIANVSEGTHQVRVELDGFNPWVGVVRVKGGSRMRVGASLEP